MPAARFGLPRTARLRTPGDFRRVYGRGSRAHGKLLVAVGLPRREPGHRLGVAVSKEHGHAVRRNKLKRILREAYEEARSIILGEREAIERLTRGLLRYETLDRGEIERLIDGADPEGLRPEPRPEPAPPAAKAETPARPESRAEDADDFPTGAEPSPA